MTLRKRHHSCTGARFSILELSWAIWKYSLYVREPQFYWSKTMGCRKSSIVIKIDHQKPSPSTPKKYYIKSQFFLNFFAPGTSENSAPVETKWRFLEMALKNICFPDVSFNHIFSSRNQVFRHTSTRRIIRKPCVLQGVSMIFTLEHSNEGRKKHSNYEQKILKNRCVNLTNRAFVETKP